MKKSVIAGAIIAVTLFFSTSGFAGQPERHGLFLGAGSGAAIGHAIGRTPEAALIGSAIGGVVGVAVAQAHRHGLPLPPPFVIPPPFPPPQRFSDNVYGHGYSGREPRYRNGYSSREPRYRHEYSGRESRYRHDYRDNGPRCRISEKTIYKYGRPYTITKKICKEDSYYNHYRDRDRRWNHR